VIERRRRKKKKKIGRPAVTAILDRHSTTAARS
jgi:hypothetical protein